jgi:hypothetical protein
MCDSSKHPSNVANHAFFHTLLLEASGSKFYVGYIYQIQHLCLYMIIKNKIELMI